VPEPQSNPLWNDSYIQFTRLLAEIAATQPNLDIPALAESMNLMPADVDELFDRAQSEFETLKSKHCLYLA